MDTIAMQRIEETTAMRSKASRSIAFLIGVVALATASASANTVTFDGLAGGPWGDLYGTQGAELILAEDQIEMRARSFHSGESLYFVYTDLEPARVDFGDGQILRVSNMAVEFDFGAVPEGPGVVEFDFAHFGGTENLMVNSHTMHQGNLSSLNGVEVAPGVTSLVATESIAGGVRGHFMLVGEVWNVWIGGQEFYLDNVLINPPLTGAEDATWSSIKDLFR